MNWTLLAAKLAALGGEPSTLTEVRYRLRWRRQENVSRAMFPIRCRGNAILPAMSLSVAGAHCIVGADDRLVDVLMLCYDGCRGVGSFLFCCSPPPRPVLIVGGVVRIVGVASDTRQHRHFPGPSLISGGCHGLRGSRVPPRAFPRLR